MKRTLLFLSLFVGLAQGAAAQTPAPAPLLLTEVYYDTPGRDDREEWFELYHFGAGALALDRFKVGDEERPGGGEGMVRFPDGATAAPGQAIVVAQSAVGFRALFGRQPDYELQDSDPAVPDMVHYGTWAGGMVALANDGDELLLLDADNRPIDGVAYGDSGWQREGVYAGPAVAGVRTGQSLERVPAGCDSHGAADWQARNQPTPGQVSLEGDCVVAPAGAPPAADVAGLLPIGQVQGRGDVSPFTNQVVSFRGVVTGEREEENSRGLRFYTVFVQSRPGEDDGDGATSDGVAVFLGQERPSVAVGDLVRVTGRVTEFFGLTEIDDEGLLMVVEGRNQALPEAVELNPPADNVAAAAYYEPLEGMLVAISIPAVVVGPTFAGCSLAVVRQDSGLAQVFRHSTADPIGQIIPVLHSSDVACDGFPNARSGDILTGVTGPLIYHFDQFKVVQQASEGLALTAGPRPPPPVAPELGSGQISVATFNVENYFDLLDDTSDDGELEPTAEEVAIKQAKLVYAIGRTLRCPTLVAVTEVEKESLLMELAGLLAADCGFIYQVSHRESADARGIDVALLSDPRRVTVEADGVGLHQLCTPLATGIRDTTAGCPEGEAPLFGRPPLQVRLAVDGDRYTVLVNHFKSKREGEVATEAFRLAQARHVAEISTALLTEDAETRLIVLGDFNDYLYSPVMAVLTGEGRLGNALAQAPPAERYSYVFIGASQLTDGILLSPALQQRVEAVTILHVNADYPSSLAMDTSPAGLPYRSSDHDIPLVVLQGVAAPRATPPPATIRPTDAVTPAPTDTIVAPATSTRRPTTWPRPTASANLTPAAAAPSERREAAVILWLGAAVAAAGLAVWWRGRR